MIPRARGGDRLGEGVSLMRRRPPGRGRRPTLRRGGLPRRGRRARVTVAGRETGLADPGRFAGHARGGILLQNNGLKIELVIDRTTEIGSGDPAGLSDVRLESAISDDHGLRGFGGLRRCEEQGRGLWHLARADAGRPRGDLRQRGGRQITRRLRPGCGLPDAGGRGADGQGAVPDAGAQRRASDDHARWVLTADGTEIAEG